MRTFNIGKGEVHESITDQNINSSFAVEAFKNFKSTFAQKIFTQSMKMSG